MNGRQIVGRGMRSQLAGSTITRKNANVTVGKSTVGQARCSRPAEEGTAPACSLRPMPDHSVLIWSDYI
jgi:hypothetical protein